MGLGRLIKRKRLNGPQVWTEEDAVLFLQSRGSISMTEFARLDPESRRAFAKVGQDYTADLVATLASAIRDEAFTDRLAARLDGGERREANAITTALEAVVRKVAGGVA